MGWTPSPWLRDAQEAAYPPTSIDERWRRRPFLSGVVRFAVVAIPVAASLVAAIVTSRLLPVPGGGALRVGWWVAILALSTVVLLAVDTVARRLLPLAILLNLSMVFPDKAPDRFWVAFRAGTVRNLERRLSEARHRGLHDEPAKAAAEIITLVAAITAHDRRTRGHSERVRAFNDLIAEEMHLPEADRDRLRWAALLHDAGKLRTPPQILNKPGPPTAAEWRQLHQHPEAGARITAPLHSWLGPWAPTIEQHHERWDGRGYPKGLTGEEISLGARIVSVADAYEVMTSPRPYRRAMSARAAREELARGAAGTQFDPAVVRAFLNISLGRLRRIVGPIAWALQFPFLVSMPRLEVAAAAVGRQLLATAGTATAVGVLAVSGFLDASPSTPSTPVASQSTAAGHSAPSEQPKGTVAPRSAAQQPTAQAGADTSGASPVGAAQEGQPSDRSASPAQPGGAPIVTIPDPSSLVPELEILLPSLSEVPLIDPPVRRPPLPVDPALPEVVDDLLPPEQGY